jgi:hypothetical protein
VGRADRHAVDVEVDVVDVEILSRRHREDRRERRHRAIRRSRPPA